RRSCRLITFPQCYAAIARRALPGSGRKPSSPATRRRRKQRDGDSRFVVVRKVARQSQGREKCDKRGAVVDRREGGDEFVRIHGALASRSARRCSTHASSSETSHPTERTPSLIGFGASPAF